MSRYVGSHFKQHAVICKPIWFLHHNCLNLPWLASNTRRVRIHVATTWSNRQTHAILHPNRSQGCRRLRLECRESDRPLLPHDPGRNRCVGSIGIRSDDTSTDDQGSIRLHFGAYSPRALAGANPGDSLFKSDNRRASCDAAKVLGFASHSREGWRREYLRASRSRRAGQGTRHPLSRNPYGSPPADHRRHPGLMARPVCRVPCPECRLAELARRSRGAA